MKKFLIAFLGISICTFATLSCTRLDIAINWADTYIASQVDDYFDLDYRQNKNLKESLKKDIGKIRKEQFTQWAAELRLFENDLRENTLNQKNFHKYFAETLRAAQKLQAYFINTAMGFISTTTPVQLDHFELTIRKKSIKDEKQIQNSQKTSNESRKKYLTWTSLWIDSLSKDQEQLLNQHLSEYPFPTQLQINNKKHILEKFHEARTTLDRLQNFVRSYYNDKYQFADPEYRQALDTYQAGLEKFLFQLVNSLSEKQKIFLSENLLEKASSLETLAAKN